jgi:hypothetical protein
LELKEYIFSLINKIIILIKFNSYKNININKTMKINHKINMFRIVNQNNNNKTKFNETFDYNKNTYIQFEKRNKNKEDLKLILPNIKSISPYNNNKHSSTDPILNKTKSHTKLINKKIQIINKNYPNMYNIKDNKKQIINNKNNTNNHMDMSNKINNIIIENKVKKNEKIPDDFKNLKILGNNETIFDKNQHSNSTISQISVFQSLKNGRKNSNISFGFESLFSLSEEEIKIKKEIDPESFKKFCKKINDILNLNYNKY